MLFYRCEKCGNFITFLTEKAATPFCCGEIMVEVVANTVDAAQEKHVPVVEVKGSEVEVKVGSVAHPMIPEHYIPFVILETSLGCQKRELLPGQEPAAKFALAEGEKPLAAYEYCNLHGLWKAVI
ncbi:MAG TPA: desulfoferrodoxin family protein [Bacillota bacterium]|nr:desulfoferrodoxin family protein [Bacillota bacterium]HQC36431.1 desulfoferrodoxin family protein [Bacillota bacterium]